MLFLSGLFRISARFLLAIVLLSLGGCRPDYPPPPGTARRPVYETLHGVEFRDPYRWLEEQDSPQTRAWIDRQNAYAEEILGQTPLRQQVLRRLTQLMDRGSAGNPAGCGEWEYFALRRRGQPLEAIYRRPAAESPTPVDLDGQYEEVLPTPPPRNGITVQVAQVSQSPDCRYLIYSLRAGGEDETELHIRDLQEGRDLEEVFPRGLYSSVAFTPDNRQFYYSHRSRQNGARIRLHTLGTPLASDPDIFGAGFGPDKFIGIDLADEGRLAIFSVDHGWSRSEIYLQDLARDSPVLPLTAGLDALFSARFRNGRVYLQTDYGADNYRVLRVDPVHPEQENWEEFIAEGPDVLQNYQFINGKLYLSYLHEVSSRIEIRSEEGTKEGEIPLPPFSQARVRRYDDRQLLLTTSSYLQPSRTVKWDPASGQQELWDEEDVDFDAEALTLEQVWYESKDGTRVPMYVLRRKDLKMDGSAPALLTGYGGFNVAQGPRFDTTAIFWVERGGVFAQPNLRGGIEFGEKWHRGGNLENKQNVFDDFIAAAEWLIAHHYTSAGKLAIRGASNGGLLVASALTQRPDLFRAVACGFPDLDMVRFYTFTETNNLPALHEYGNAAIPEQFEFLRKYSPYQAVRPGVAYPAVILSTGDRDTRVPPLQARKMTATLQFSSSSGLPVILRYSPEAGHAAGRGEVFAKRVENLAAEMTFLLQQLGEE